MDEFLLNSALNKELTVLTYTKVYSFCQSKANTLREIHHKQCFCTETLLIMFNIS